MQGVLTSFFLLTIFLLFVDMKKGLLLYIAITFLVPSLSIFNIGIPIKWNYLNVFIFSLLILNCVRRHKTIRIGPLRLFIVYYCWLLFIGLFAAELSIIEQVGVWIGHIFRNFTIPIALLTLCSEEDSKYVQWTNYVVYTISALACLYGLFIISMDGLNPYIMLIQNDDSLMEYMNASDSRIFGRVSSVFTHPMTFGCFLVDVFFFCAFKIMDNTDRIINIILLILISLCCLLCGVRSVIGGVVVGIFAFLILNRKRKYFFLASIFLLLVVYVVSYSNVLSTFLGSIFEASNDSAIGGSSIQLRIRQFVGCFEVISSNILFGMGYDWSNIYNKLVGVHPLLLAFESYIFVVLCNSGLLGICLWIHYMYKILALFYRYFKNHVDRYGFMMILYLAYTSYICITGDYGYMMFFSFFYSLIYLNIKTKNKVT